MSTDYVVTWSMNISADDATDAAQQALGIHRDPQSIATVFMVDEPDGKRMKIDLHSDGSVNDVQIEQHAPGPDGNPPRKGTKFEYCTKHAGWFQSQSKRRQAECFVEGGPGGEGMAGCKGGLCRVWPGTDFYDPSYCHGELTDSALSWTMSGREPYDFEMEGNGFLTITDADDNVQRYGATREQAHDLFGLEVDCERCKGGEEQKHKYDEPMITDLTDCIDGCGINVDHTGPCKER